MPKRPNLIWIFGDQHRAQSLGYAGDPNVSTPNVDRLAGEGLTLRGVSGSPLCCPYRGSLLSGCYPHRVVPGHEHPLPDGQKTVANAFNDAGYHTAWFGKWHVGGFHERDGRAGTWIVPPERRGAFATWIGYENNNAQWDCWVHGHRDQTPVALSRLPGFETDCLTDLFLEHLGARASAYQRDGTPFFAALSVQPPHDPYVAPEAWMQRHRPADVQLRPNVPRGGAFEQRVRRELAGYHAMIENLDWNLGRVRAALSQLNIADDTHIIFFSDHGDMHGSHGQLRKTTAYAESIDVPMVFGGMTLYGQHRGQAPSLINHVDLAPTSLGLCGIDKPQWMQGTDYSRRRVRGRAAVSEPDSAFLQMVQPTGHWASVAYPWRGVLTVDGWKYVCLPGMPWLLFNLNDDPYEQANHALNPAYTAERKKLQDRLAQWINDTGDRFELPEV